MIISHIKVGCVEDVCCLREEGHYFCRNVRTLGISVTLLGLLK